MANIKAAEKKIRVIEKKTLVNKRRKSEIKTYIKKFDQLIDAENYAEAEQVLKLIDKKLKKAEQRNLLNKNNVSRKMSQLHRKLNVAASK
ncbi:30S ribosomal protein S20 [Ezakiella peruensis]|uniref:30S ribosomal protein S20 n=1 Tax=Ezakiella peruensis TaxID=1464038 RepID=UPI000C1B5664|nr:30S ribosomal protein S20 [Ezakiella peruensis]